MRGLLTDFARRRSLRNKGRADVVVAIAMLRARKLNDRAAFWNDVRIFLAGLDTWSSLKAKRQARRRRVTAFSGSVNLNGEARP